MYLYSTPTRKKRLRNGTERKLIKQKTGLPPEWPVDLDADLPKLGNGAFGVVYDFSSTSVVKRQYTSVDEVVAVGDTSYSIWREMFIYNWINRLPPAERQRFTGMIRYIARPLDKNQSVFAFDIEIEKKDWSWKTKTLRERVPLSHVLQMGVDVIQALSMMCKAELVHEDTHEGNILEKDGRFGVADFSISSGTGFSKDEYYNERVKQDLEYSSDIHRYIIPLLISPYDMTVDSRTHAAAWFIEWKLYMVFKQLSEERRTFFADEIDRICKKAGKPTLRIQERELLVSKSTGNVFELFMITSPNLVLLPALVYIHEYAFFLEKLIDNDTKEWHPVPTEFIQLIVDNFFGLADGSMFRAVNEWHQKWIKDGKVGETETLIVWPPGDWSIREQIINSEDTRGMCEYTAHTALVWSKLSSVEFKEQGNTKYSIWRMTEFYRWLNKQPPVTQKRFSLATKTHISEAGTSINPPEWMKSRPFILEDFNELAQSKYEAMLLVEKKKTTWLDKVRFARPERVTTLHMLVDVLSTMSTLASNGMAHRNIRANNIFYHDSVFGLLDYRSVLWTAHKLTTTEQASIERDDDLVDFFIPLLMSPYQGNVEHNEKLSATSSSRVLEDRIATAWTKLQNKQPLLKKLEEFVSLNADEKACLQEVKQGKFLDLYIGATCRNLRAYLPAAMYAFEYEFTLLQLFGGDTNEWHPVTPSLMSVVLNNMKGLKDFSLLRAFAQAVQKELVQ